MDPTGITAIIKAIPAFIEALPEMLKLANRGLDVAERLVKWTKENGAELAISHLERTTNDLERAKTRDEKTAATDRLIDDIRNI